MTPLILYALVVSLNPSYAQEVDSYLILQRDLNREECHAQLGDIHNERVAFKGVGNFRVDAGGWKNVPLSNGGTGVTYFCIMSKSVER